MSNVTPLLLLGEVMVDVTLTSYGHETKARLGGVTHAARALWASEVPYYVAAFVPTYLEEQVRHYFKSIGCLDFIRLGSIDGSPNVVLIDDPTEISDQRYEILLRDNKTTIFDSSLTKEDLPSTLHALAFPGAYDLNSLAALLDSNTQLNIDIAYDINNIDMLKWLPCNLGTIFLSTSSHLFDVKDEEDLKNLVSKFDGLGIDALTIKENRGGVRVFTYKDDKPTYDIGAQLGNTINSVGVGDVFDAVYLANQNPGYLEAALRASWASSSYAQTTNVDTFARYIHRINKLTLDDLENLKGVSLPWEDRPNKKIYLAAPDFAESDRAAIDVALTVLEYHNFEVTRPVKINGELNHFATPADLQITYNRDIELLRDSDLVFAVPTARDPGALVEIGYAQKCGIPVVVYDPTQCSKNTMLIGGCAQYTVSLNKAINEVFYCLSKDSTNE